MIVTIDYDFKTLNQYIEAERTNKFIAAKFKQEDTEAARLMVLDKQKITGYPILVAFTWFRKDERTDPDNIAFATKFILDGFVKGGLLEGDGWKYINGISNTFRKASWNYVAVEITVGRN